MGCFCISPGAVVDDTVPPSRHGAASPAAPVAQPAASAQTPVAQQQQFAVSSKALDVPAATTTALPPMKDAVLLPNPSAALAQGVPASCSLPQAMATDPVASMNPQMPYEQQLARQQQELAALQAMAMQAFQQQGGMNAHAQQLLLAQQQQLLLLAQQQAQAQALQAAALAQAQQQQQQVAPQQAPVLPGRHPADYATDPLACQTRYVKLRDIGSGTYGFVIAAKDTKTGENVAIKFLERGKTLGKMVEREILSHRLCSAHPHIVQFKELFLTPRYLAIVMEFASGGDLFEFTLNREGHLTEDEARLLFQQLVSAVAFCHRVGVVNRDIKLENALLAPCPETGVPCLKLCDFGYSKNEHVDSACKTAAGTPEYVAPEMVLTQGNYDGKAADVWSCGIFLYVVLNGAYPFHTEPGDKLAIKRMVKGLFKFHVDVSPACEDLARRMLVANPVERISIEDVMCHPWYLHNLPAGLARVNKRVPKALELPQDEQEIRKIVEQAQEVDAAALGAALRFRRP